MFKIGSNKIDLGIDKKNYFDIFTKISSLDNLHSFINEQPVYPEWRERIQRMEFLRAVQGTIALEGSDLELDDVERIVSTDEVSISDRDKEAENALGAYVFIQQWSSDNPDGEITESVIKQIHTIMTRGINYYLNEPGKYRNQVVEFGYPRKKAPLSNQFEIQEAMTRVIEIINSNSNSDVLFTSYCYSPVTKALLVHYLLTVIHPFIDGNGRVARAVEALILHHQGKYEPYLFPVTAKFYYKERREYFEKLNITDKTNDIHSFIMFGIKGLTESLTEIKTDILDGITKTLILDYAHQLRRNKKLLKRQTALLENMFFLKPMETGELWRQSSIRAIYFKLSESTRKRDISNLISHDLLKNFESPSEGKVTLKVGVNWDVLKFVTLRLDNIPHRPRK